MLTEAVILADNTVRSVNLKQLLYCFVATIVSSLGSEACGAEGKLKGLAFFDYYFIATGPDKKENGFMFRRVYLTFDLKWNKTFSGRVRLEAKDAGFGKTSKMEPFVKHAYLRYRRNRSEIYCGLFGTPTWNVSERIWGYRSISKTMMDLRKIGSSADLGIGFKCKLDEGGKVNVQFSIGNGSGQAPEVDNSKKLYGLLHLKPTGTIEATAYLDWESKSEGQDRITLAGMLGISGKLFHGGVEGFVRTNKESTDGSNVQVRGVGAFGSGRIGPRTKAFARLDFYDPSNRVPDDREYLIIAGIDLMPEKNIHIMPNVVTTVFQTKGVDAIVIPRMTVYFKF